MRWTHPMKFVPSYVLLAALSTDGWSHSMLTTELPSHLTFLILDSALIAMISVFPFMYNGVTQRL